MRVLAASTAALLALPARAVASGNETVLEPTAVHGNRTDFRFGVALAEGVAIVQGLSSSPLNFPSATSLRFRLGGQFSPLFGLYAEPALVFVLPPASGTLGYGATTASIVAQFNADGAFFGAVGAGIGVGYPSNIQVEGFARVGFDVPLPVGRANSQTELRWRPSALSASIEVREMAAVFYPVNTVVSLALGYELY